MLAEFVNQLAHKRWISNCTSYLVACLQIEKVQYFRIQISFCGHASGTQIKKSFDTAMANVHLAETPITHPIEDGAAAIYALPGEPSVLNLSACKLLNVGTEYMSDKSQPREMMPTDCVPIHHCLHVALELHEGSLVGHASCLQCPRVLNKKLHHECEVYPACLSLSKMDYL